MDNQVYVPRLNPTPASSYQRTHRQTPPRTKYSHNNNNYAVNSSTVSSAMPSAYRKPIVADTQYQSKQQYAEHKTSTPSHPILRTPESQRGIRVVGSNSPSRSEMTNINRNNKITSQVESSSSSQQETTVASTTEIRKNQPQSKLFNNFHMPNFLIEYGNEITITCFFISLILIIYSLSWDYAEPSPDTCRRNKTTQTLFREKLAQFEDKSFNDDVKNANYEVRLKREKYRNNTTFNPNSGSIDVFHNNFQPPVSVNNSTTWINPRDELRYFEMDDKNNHQINDDNDDGEQNDFTEEESEGDEGDEGDEVGSELEE